MQMSNVLRHMAPASPDERADSPGPAPKVVWLTGLSGAGKTTLANLIVAELARDGRHSVVLDGDALRLGLNRDLGFSPEDRRENVRRVGEVSRLMHQAGLTVVAALVSPFAVDRLSVRELFAPGDFVEVWVRTPLHVCMARDPKGLYRQAALGHIPDMTGVGQDYEPPENPEFVVDGSGDMAAQALPIIGSLLGAADLIRLPE